MKYFFNLFLIIFLPRLVLIIAFVKPLLLGLSSIKNTLAPNSCSLFFGYRATRASFESAQRVQLK